MIDKVETTQSARDELRILGRIIGTYNGWDGDATESMIFYAFKPIDVLETELPEGDLNVDYEQGNFSYFEGDGTLYKTFDMLTILTMVRKDKVL